MSVCCGNLDCALTCPHALLAWSAELEQRPVTFDAFMAQSPKDSDTEKDRRE